MAVAGAFLILRSWWVLDGRPHVKNKHSDSKIKTKSFRIQREKRPLLADLLQLPSQESKMASPVVQGIDTLTSAMKSNIIPDQEYLLQGSLLDSNIEVLQHRLRGLCDNNLDGEITFSEREMVFSIRGTTQQPLSLRVRKPEGQSLQDSQSPWQLRYLGQT